MPANNENITPPVNKQEKTTYGRLRVLTAPPTSVNELGENNKSRIDFFKFKLTISLSIVQHLSLRQPAKRQ